MSVYVDELRTYIIHQRHGPQWCHLLADSVAELHVFATRLGLKRHWFQDGRWPHYDLTVNKRALAIQLGAKEIHSRDWITAHSEELPGRS